MCASLAKRQRGLSLIELILFIVIIGVALLPVLKLLGVSTSASADPVLRKQALLIAEGYMEEVQLARFTFCDAVDNNALTATDTTGCAATAEGIGPETGNTRPYDNVSDYATVVGTAQRAFAATIAGKLVDTDAAGSALATNALGNTLGNNSLARFTTTVTLNVLTGAAGALGVAGKTITSTATPQGMNALRITIRTTYGTGADDYVEIDGYRTRYAPNSIP